MSARGDKPADLYFNSPTVSSDDAWRLEDQFIAAMTVADAARVLAEGSLYHEARVIRAATQRTRKAAA